MEWATQQGKAMLLNPSNAEKISSKGQGYTDFYEPPKPCHIGFHWIALAAYPQMSTHVPSFQLLFQVLHHFVFAKLATSSITVNL